MQWSADRNAGFSMLIPIGFIYRLSLTLNTITKQLTLQPNKTIAESLLWWMKKIIALRKRYHALAMGSLNFLYPDNPKVLAFVTSYKDQQILVVANLSRFPEYVELDLTPWKGMSLLELFGQNTFPPIDNRPYFLSLAPYLFYWFLLQPPTVTTASDLQIKKTCPFYP